MTFDAAVIGGTGIGEVLSAMPGAPIHIPTKFGTIRGRSVRRGSTTIIALSRHAAGHRLPPHAVPYRALAEAARMLGVRACFATAAVGSLRPDWPAGTLALCTDFVDISARNVTMFSDVVRHTDFTEPFSEMARSTVLKVAESMDATVQPQAVYINGPGPRYETPHEIELFQSIGDIVGMTAASEAVVMREAGVPYTCLAIVSNLAAGLSDSHLSHEEVVQEMQRSGPIALELLLASCENIARNG